MDGEVPAGSGSRSYAPDVAFPRNLLHDDEELVLDLRPHWIFMALPVAIFAGVVLLAILLIGVWGPDGSVGDAITILVVAGVVGSLAFFGWKYLVWSRTMFVLTSDRIVTRRGVLTKSGVEIPLERINTVHFHQRVIERMFGSGDLSIESASEQGTQTFNDIRKPSVVQKEIYVQMEANEDRGYQKMHNAFGQSLGAAAPAEPSIPDQIEKLAELHQRGVLSDAEYQRKKAELLDRM